MKRELILAVILILAAVFVSAQAPQLATYPDIVTSQTAASVDLMSYKSVVEGNIATVFQLEQNDAGAIAALQTAVANIPEGTQGPVGPAGPAGPQGVAGPQGAVGPPGPAGSTLAPPVELLLVMPFGTTGFSTWNMTSTLSEYATAPRTRRILDFTNVHAFRICASVLTGAPGFIEADQSANQTTWAQFGPQLSISTAGLSCAPWTVYAGAAGDQFIRISGAGSGTPVFEMISLQVK